MTQPMDQALIMPKTTRHPTRAHIVATGSSDKWQPTATKLEILRSHCVDQAIQCERAGLVADASEWRELGERVRGLG